MAIQAPWQENREGVVEALQNQVGLKLQEEADQHLMQEQMLLKLVSNL